MKDYFKPAYTFWFYSFDSFLGNIKETIAWIKQFLQRGFRGYADIDTWELFAYLNQIIIPLLTYLRDNHCGFPAKYTDKKWIDSLNVMIKGFEASDRMAESDYPMSTFQTCWNIDEKIFKKGMKEFTKHYLSLWD